MTGFSQSQPVLNVGVGSLCGFRWPCPVFVGFVLFAEVEAEARVVVAASAPASANGEAATTAARAVTTRAKRMVGGYFRG